METKVEFDNRVEVLDSKSKIEEEISFDEALNRTKFGKFNYALIVLCGIILACVFFETMGISYALPVAECDLRVTTKQQYGIINGVSFGGITLSSHLWGYLGDERGRKAIIVPTLFIAFFFTILSSFSTSFWMFTIFRFFNGFFVSGSASIVFAYLGEFHGIKSRSRAIMIASSVFGACCVCLPLTAWFVINQDFQFYIPVLDIVYKPWRLFIVCCGFMSFCSALFLTLFPESPKYTFSQGDEVTTYNTLKLIYRVNTGKTDYNCKRIIKDSEFDRRIKAIPETPSCVVCDGVKQQTLALFTQKYLRSTIVTCALQFGIYSVSNGMLLFFPDILNQIAYFMETNPNSRSTICEILESEMVVGNKTKFEAALINSCIEKLDITAYTYSILVELLYAVGFLIMGLIINIVGKLPLITFILLITGSSAIAINFNTVPEISIYLYVVLLACGLCGNLVNISTLDLFPTNLRSMAVSMSLMFGRFGSMVGGNVVGTLLDKNYCNLTFTMSGFLLCSTAILAFFIPNIFKVKSTSLPVVNKNPKSNTISNKI